MDVPYLFPGLRVYSYTPWSPQHECRDIVFILIVIRQNNPNKRKKLDKNVWILTRFVSKRQIFYYIHKFVFENIINSENMLIIIIATQIFLNVFELFLFKPFPSTKFLWYCNKFAFSLKFVLNKNDN